MADEDESEVVSISQMQPSIDDRDYGMENGMDVSMASGNDSVVDDDDSLASVRRIFRRDRVMHLAFDKEMLQDALGTMAMDDDDTTAAVSSIEGKDKDKDKDKGLVIDRMLEEEMIQAARKADDGSGSSQVDILDEIFGTIEDFICQEKHPMQQQKQPLVASTDSTHKYIQGDHKNYLSPAASHEKDVIDIVFENLENATCNSNYSRITMMSTAIKNTQGVTTGGDNVSAKAAMERSNAALESIQQALKKLKESASASTLDHSKEKVQAWLSEFEGPATCAHLSIESLQARTAEFESFACARGEEPVETTAPFPTDLLDHFFQRVEDSLCRRDEIVLNQDGELISGRGSPYFLHPRDKDVLDTVFETIENATCESKETARTIIRTQSHDVPAGAPGGITQDVGPWSPQSEASSSIMSLSTFRSPASSTGFTTQSEFSRSTFSFSDHSRTSTYAEETVTSETTSVTNTTPTRSEHVALVSASESHDENDNDDDCSELVVVNRPLFVITEEVSSTESTISDKKQSQRQPIDDIEINKKCNKKSYRRYQGCGEKESSDRQHYHQYQAIYGSTSSNSGAGVGIWLRRLRLAMDFTISRLTTVLEQSTAELSALCGPVKCTSREDSDLEASLVRYPTTDTTVEHKITLVSESHRKRCSHHHQSTSVECHKTISEAVSKVPSDECLNSEHSTAREEHEEPRRTEHPIARNRRRLSEDLSVKNIGRNSSSSHIRVDPEPVIQGIKYHDLVAYSMYHKSNPNPSENDVPVPHSKPDPSIHTVPLIKSPKSSESDKTGATAMTADETTTDSIDNDENENAEGESSTDMHNQSLRLTLDDSKTLTNTIACTIAKPSMDDINGQRELNMSSSYQQRPCPRTTLEQGNTPNLSLQYHRRINRSEVSYTNSTLGARGSFSDRAVTSSIDRETPKQSNAQTVSLEFSSAQLAIVHEQTRAAVPDSVLSFSLANELEEEEEENDDLAITNTTEDRIFGIFDETDGYSFYSGLSEMNQNDSDDAMVIRTACTDIVLYEEKPLNLSNISTPWHLFLYMAWMSVSFLIKFNGTLSSQLCKRKDELQKRLESLKGISEIVEQKRINYGHSQDSWDAVPCIEQQESSPTADNYLKVEDMEC